MMMVNIVVLICWRHYTISGCITVRMRVVLLIVVNVLLGQTARLVNAASTACVKHTAVNIMTIVQRESSVAKNQVPMGLLLNNFIAITHALARIANNTQTVPTTRRSCTTTPSVAIKVFVALVYAIMNVIIITTATENSTVALDDILNIAMKAALLMIQTTKTIAVYGGIADNQTLTIVAKKNPIHVVNVQEIVLVVFVAMITTVHGLMNAVAPTGIVLQ